MRRAILCVTLCLTLTACGAAGPPEPPLERPAAGVTVGGSAEIGVVGSR